MAILDREKFLSQLNDAAPALPKTAVIPELSHFWFDTKYVYATDAGLGVRLECLTELNCGIPGKILLDLLKTSALKEVSVEQDEDDVVLQLGKAKMDMASLEAKRFPWKFPEPDKKSKATLALTSKVLEAFNRVDLMRVTHPTRVFHNGVTVVPYEDAVEFYSTDSASMARVAVEEAPPKALPSVVVSWGLVERMVKLAAPGSVLHVLEDALVVIGEGVMLCANRLELPTDYDLPTIFDRSLPKNVRAEVPAGLSQLLDRAVILAGRDNPVVEFNADGKVLRVSGKYTFGSFAEPLEFKGKGASVRTKFLAELVRRGLRSAQTMDVGEKGLALFDGEEFGYVVQRERDVEREARPKPGRESEPEEAVEEKAPKRRRRGAKAELEDEIPF